MTRFAFGAKCGSEGRPPAEPRYRQWVETYADPGFAALAAWCAGLLDRVAAGLPPRGNDVRAAELQVYSSKHRVHGAKLVESHGGGKHDDD
jgi:thiaminase